MKAGSPKRKKKSPEIVAAFITGGSYILAGLLGFGIALKMADDSPAITYVERPQQPDTLTPEAVAIDVPSERDTEITILVASPLGAPEAPTFVAELQRAVEGQVRDYADIVVAPLGGSVVTAEQAEALLGYGVDVLVWFEYSSSPTHATVTGHVDSKSLPDRLATDSSYPAFDATLTTPMSQLDDFSLQRDLSQRMLFPVVFSAAYLVGERGLDTTDFREAVALLDRAIASIDSSIEGHTKWESLANDLAARMLAFLDDRDGALERSDLALSLSRDPSTIWNRGYVHEILGEYADAIEWYTTGIELYPDEPHLRLNRAKTAVAAYDAEGTDDYLVLAISDMDALLGIDADSSSAHFWRARALISSGQYSQSLDDLLAYNALTTGPTDEPSSWVLARIGFAYESDGNLTLAIDHYSWALEIDPNYVWALHRRALLRIGSDDLGAVSDLTRALEESGPEPWALTVRAQVFRRLGATDLAAADDLAAAEASEP